MGLTFLRFLAWAFYWMRLELAALGQPERACSVTRERGRWRVVFGESTGEGREAWCAIRQMLEGRDEREPLELTPEALARVADALEERHDELEAARLAELERESSGIGQSELELAGDGETLGDSEPAELVELDEQPRRGF